METTGNDRPVIILLPLDNPGARLPAFIPGYADGQSRRRERRQNNTKRRTIPNSDPK